MICPPRPAVLLDRDGVINRTFAKGGVSLPPGRVEEFEFLPKVIEAASRLADAGWLLVVVTNQPDVARGKQSRGIVEQMHRRLVEQMPVLEVFTCYHDAGDKCACRKPKPGLLLEAARRWNIDLARSIMIGDRWSDVLAGQAAGCMSILVENPHSGGDRCQPDLCVRDLTEAANWITQSFPKRGAA